MNTHAQKPPALDAHPGANSPQNGSQSPLNSAEEPRAVEQLYTVADAMHILKMRRSSLYELMRAGRLRYVKEGRMTRFTGTALRNYIALLEQEGEEAYRGKTA